MPALWAQTRTPIRAPIITKKQNFAVIKITSPNLSWSARHLFRLNQSISHQLHHQNGTSTVNDADNTWQHLAASVASNYVWPEQNAIESVIESNRLHLYWHHFIRFQSLSGSRFLTVDRQSQSFVWIKRIILHALQQSFIWRSLIASESKVLSVNPSANTSSKSRKWCLADNQTSLHWC